MSLLFQRRALGLPNQLLPPRSSAGKYAPRVTADAALQQSVVWAATNLRANLMSMFPIDTFRVVDGIQVEVPKPPVLISPSGDQMSMGEWMYSTQMDLDRVGNCYGIIRELDGQKKPRRIDLVTHSDVVVRSKDDVITYYVRGKKYDANEIWHERQYTVPGLAVGLSPVANAAWTLGVWRSATEFGMEWFGNHGIIPNAHLKNVKQTLTDTIADKIKERYKVAVEGGDIFVTGNDWEFTTVPSAEADARYLEQQGASNEDAARFFGVPGDLVDVASKGSAITYANITQRNLQFLIMNLAGAVKRREDALTRLIPDPWFVKLNTAALLRMDPETTSKILAAEVAGRITAPSEARALMNRAPFTPEQEAEFARLWPNIFGQGKTEAAVARNVAEMSQKIYLAVDKVMTADEARDILNTAGANLTGSFTPSGGQ